ncbi:MAG: aminoglycoside phosphotransferase family protein [Litoreibacter sp.]
MFLTASNLIHFLLDRDLLSAADVVGRPVAIVESGRRCRNFKVHQGERDGLFVKQIRTTAPDAIETLTREAKFYEMVTEAEDLTALKKLIPAFSDFDTSRHALTVGLVPEAENVNEVHFRLQRFPPEIGELLGRGLGTYHKEAAISAQGFSSGLFPGQLPWILHLDPQTLAPLNTFGPNVGPPLIEMLCQRPYLLAHLETLGAGYQFDTLIHGDMKWDNMVVHPVTKGGAHDLKVIDWELADIGDAAWDIASVFASYILYVLLSQPQMGAVRDPKAPTRQDLLLVNAKPSMARFWESYVEMRGFDRNGGRIGLIRTMTYLAARLVVSVFEGLINNTMQMQQAVMLMDMAEQVARMPQKAAFDIIGPLDS